MTAGIRPFPRSRRTAREPLSVRGSAAIDNVFDIPFFQGQGNKSLTPVAGLGGSIDLWRNSLRFQGYGWQIDRHRIQDLLKFGEKRLRPKSQQNEKHHRRQRRKR